MKKRGEILSSIKYRGIIWKPLLSRFLISGQYVKKECGLRIMLNIFIISNHLSVKQTSNILNIPIPTLYNVRNKDTMSNDRITLLIYKMNLYEQEHYE